MSATAITRQSDKTAELRRRETATAEAVHAIDEKLARLNLARRVRAVALNRIRCELARENELVAPESHERRP